MKENNVIKKGWNDIAIAYQKRYDIQVGPIVYSPLGPTEDELNLLGKNLKNKKIIDIGAGGCQKAIYLAKKGAKITSFDLSIKQLEYGANLAKKENVSINCVRGDFANLSTYFKKNSFDMAYSIFALQYCANSNMLKKVFCEINSILKKKGKIIISLDHPMRTCGYWDLKLDRFLVNNYFDKSINKWDYDFLEYGVLGKFEGTYYTLSDLLNSFIEAGFAIEKILEPKAIKRKKYLDKFGINSRYGVNNKKDPFNFSNLNRVPGTIILCGIKN